MRLHGYFRSSAAYRVRIALNLKGIGVEHISHHLRKGEQRAPEYLALNPQGLVPALETDDGAVLTQSLAIIRWLDETFPEPALLPADPLARAKANAFAYTIACDIHPVQNLKVLEKLRALGISGDGVQDWAAWVIRDGLSACESVLTGQKGTFCFGNTPSLADLCLIPQLANARRFKVDMAEWPRIQAVEAACTALPAFADAAPDRQPDFE